MCVCVCMCTNKNFILKFPLFKSHDLKKKSIEFVNHTENA